MRALKKYCMGVAASLLTASTPAFANLIALDITRLTGSVAQGTTVFRADLSGLSLLEMRSITFVDSNSGLGGSPGAYSGFDLDAIKLSFTFATTAADASSAGGLDVFDFSPAGTVFTPGNQRPPTAPRLNGTDLSGLNVDPDWATLASFDAIWFGIGSVTLGDGGKISFNLTSPVSTEGLYLYFGEVGTDPGEGIDGSVFVSSLEVPLSQIPEPSSMALLLAGAAGIAVQRRRRRSGSAF